MLQPCSSYPYRRYKCGKGSPTSCKGLGGKERERAKCLCHIPRHATWVVPQRVLGQLTASLKHQETCTPPRHSLTSTSKAANFCTVRNNRNRRGAAQISHWKKNSGQSWVVASGLQHLSCRREILTTLVNGNIFFSFKKKTFKVLKTSSNLCSKRLFLYVFTEQKSSLFLSTDK